MFKIEKADPSLPAIGPVLKLKEFSETLLALRPSESFALEWSASMENLVYAAGYLLPDRKFMTRKESDGTHRVYRIS